MYRIPAGTKASKCKGRILGGTCEALVYWIDDQNGQRRIIDADAPGAKRPSEAKEEGQIDVFTNASAPVFDGRGIDHHATCPDVELFRRRAH